MRLPFALTAAPHSAPPTQGRGVTQTPGVPLDSTDGRAWKGIQILGDYCDVEMGEKGASFVMLCFIKLGCWLGNQAPAPID